MTKRDSRNIRAGQIISQPHATKGKNDNLTKYYS